MIIHKIKNGIRLLQL